MAITRCKCGLLFPAAVCVRCDEGICSVCGFVNDESFPICRTCVIEIEIALERTVN
jgi:hypothetical protein